MAKKQSYPAILDVKYQKSLDRFSSFFRIIFSIPILIVISLISSTSNSEYINDVGQEITSGGGGILAGLFAATVLMIVFQQKYPKWWFDFALELNRFSARVAAYLALLTDKYPSTDEKQNIELNIEYPNVKKDLNRWLPLVKWFLALPHYIALVFLLAGSLFAIVFAWIAIIFTGKYPKSLFDYIVGVGRWCLRVNAYAFLLVTDEYPPFSLD